MLIFESYESGGVLILTVDESGYGESDRQAGNREWLYNTVQNRADGRFAVDLSSVSYLSSADFGILISLKRRIDSRKGQLILFGVNSFIVDTLQTMRLSSFFPMADDLNSALAALGD